MLLRNRTIRMVLCALLVSALVVPSAGALEVSDVPPGHWAYEAVSTLLERGYLPPGEDQLFRGDEAVDRYTLASVVAQLLAEVESGRAAATSEDLRTLQLLTEELREDLVLYYTEMRALEGRLEDAHEDLTAFDERLVQVILELGTLYARASQLEEALALADERLAASIQNEADVLAGQVGSLGRNLEALGESLSDELRRLRADVESVGELLDQRSFEQRETDSALRAELLQAVSELWAEAERLASENAALDQRITSEANDLDQRLAAESAALRAALRELERQIDFALGIQTAEVEESLIHSMRTLGSRIDELATAIFALENELQLQAALLYDLELRIDERISMDIEALQSAMSDLSTAHDDLAASHDELADAFTAELQLLREQLQALRAEQVQAQAVALADLAERLEGEVARESRETADRIHLLDGAIAEIRDVLNSHSEALAAYELGLSQLAGELQQHGAVMARTDGELLRTIEAVRAESSGISGRLADLDSRLGAVESALVGEIVTLRDRTDDLDRRIDELRQELLIVQSHVGLSEEQIEDLTRRVRDEMAEQLTLSLLREGELQRNLRDLRTEFDSYRTTSEAEIKSLRSGQAIGIGALVLGILGLVR